VTASRGHLVGHPLPTIGPYSPELVLPSTPMGLSARFARLRTREPTPGLRGIVPSMAGTTDPFELLGLPGVFSLAPDAIHAAHLSRAAAVHPDIAGGEISADEAANQAAALNRAKDQLLDAETRANVLLEMLGGPTKEQDKTLPPDFLMEMMETREEIESVIALKDRAAIARWNAWAHERRDELTREVGEMFARLSASPAHAELREIRVRLNVWRYIERLVEQLQPDYHGLRDRASS